MNDCTKSGHAFRIARDEWNVHTTYMQDGVLFEGPQKAGECTELDITCVTCGYSPDVVQEVDEASGELVWVADPWDDEEEARLRAAGFTLPPIPEEN